MWENIVMKKKRVSDLLVVEKIMGFLECSFSFCLVAEKINIRQTFFFYWATEWTLKYQGLTGPVELVGLDEGESRP